MPLAMGQIIFITGTDTGVGKTVVTALLLWHLRQSGCDALAIKPFCSGSRADGRLLRGLQDNLLTLDEISPFFFKKPVAPGATLSKFHWLGGRASSVGETPTGATGTVALPKAANNQDENRRKTIRLDTVLRKIRDFSRRCDVLLVEGIGGLMVPLGKNYTVADLISRLHCPVLVVGRNRLGTINHTLLTVNALQVIGIERVRIVLVEEKKPDISAKSNPKTIQKMAPFAPVFLIPDLGFRASSAGVIKINVKYMKKTLARILGGGNLRSFFR